MSVERRGVDRGGNMPGPYPHAGEYSAQNERCGVYGVSERQEQLDDLPKMGQHEIQVQESAILVQRLLCGHCHIFLWTLFSGRVKFCTLTCTLTFYSLKSRFYSYFCIKFDNFSKSKGAKPLKKSRYIFAL